MFNSSRNVFALLMIICSMITSCITFPDPNSHLTPPTKRTSHVKHHPDTDVMIWLLSTDLHTSLALPYAYLKDAGFIFPKDFPACRYVVISWGDEVAYRQTAWMNPWQVFRALFTPTPSVMEIIPVNWDITEVLPQQRIWRNTVDQSTGKNLARFLNQSFYSDPTSGKPRIVAPSSWGDGVLLASRYSYYYPRVCNPWTATVLQKAGFRFFLPYTMSANMLIQQAERPINGFEKIWPGDASLKQTKP